VSSARAPLVLALMATVAVGVLTPVAGSVSATLLLGYVACLTGCAVWWLLRSSLEGPSAGRERMVLRGRIAPAAPALLPARLRELERVVATGMDSALEADGRLRSELRALACALLAARRGVVVDLNADDVAARAGVSGEPLLGAAGPSRPDIRAPGPSAADIGGLLDRLEMI